MPNLQTFFGKPVIDYLKPGDIVPSAVVCPRVLINYDDDEECADRLDRLLDEPGIGVTEALVIGSWCGEDSEQTPHEIIEMLVARADTLPNLRALFVGDISSEENEMSWINQGDMSSLWAAYPKLEEFGARGGNGLRLGQVNHANLRKIVIETGGMPATLLREALEMNTPALEHFEVWTGSENYGNSTNVEQFADLLAGKLFPAMTTMALSNCDYADDLAKAVAVAPVLARIRHLDLSKGTLKDSGAKALIAGGQLGELESLTISHHFVTDPVLAELKLATRRLVADEQLKADNYGDEDYYYIAVSE